MLKQVAVKIMSTKNLFLVVLVLVIVSQALVKATSDGPKDVVRKAANSAKDSIVNGVASTTSSASTNLMNAMKAGSLDSTPINKSNQLLNGNGKKQDLATAAATTNGKKEIPKHDKNTMNKMEESKQVAKVETKNSMVTGKAPLSSIGNAEKNSLTSTKSSSAIQPNDLSTAAHKKHKKYMKVIKKKKKKKPKKKKYKVVMKKKKKKKKGKKKKYKVKVMKKKKKKKKKKGKKKKYKVVMKKKKKKKHG